jgi:hypothetical protein
MGGGLEKIYEQFSTQYIKEMLNYPHNSTMWTNYNTGLLSRLGIVRTFSNFF